MPRGLDFNHPLLLSCYRYEVLKPRKERQDRLNKICINNKHPWLDHPLMGTNFRQEFANCMNPVSLTEARRQAEPSQSKYTSGEHSGTDHSKKYIKLDNTNPLQRTSARYDFMTTKPSGPSCLIPGTIRILPNNVIRDTPYRYETRMTEQQRPTRQPRSDFKANYINPLFRTNFRYEYLKPRTAAEMALLANAGQHPLQQGCFYN